MNTKGIKFLAVLAVLAMAFAAFAVIAPAEENDAADVANLTLVKGSATPTAAINYYVEEDATITLGTATDGTVKVYVYTGATVTVKFQTGNMLDIDLVNVTKKVTITGATTTIPDEDIATATTNVTVTDGTAGSMDYSVTKKATVKLNGTVTGTMAVPGTAVAVADGESLKVTGTAVAGLAGSNVIYSNVQGDLITTYYNGAVSEIINLSTSDGHNDTVVIKGSMATISAGPNTVEVSQVNDGEEKAATFTYTYVDGTNDVLKVAGSLSAGSNVRVTEGSLSIDDDTLEFCTTNEAAGAVTGLLSFVSGFVDADFDFDDAANDGHDVFYASNKTAEVVKAEAAAGYVNIEGIYSILKKTTTFEEITADNTTITINKFSELVVPEKYTLNLGTKTAAAVKIEFTNGTSVMDVWGAIKGFTDSDPEPHQSAINNAAGIMEIRKGATISGVDVYGNGVFIELPNKVYYNEQSVSIDTSNTYDILALGGDTVIPKGVTVTITGMLALQGYDLTVLGTLVIEEGAYVGGEIAAQATVGGIFLTDGATYGTITLNGVAGKNIPVEIAGQEMVGLSGITIKQSSTATTVGGELALVDSMLSGTLELNGASIANMTVCKDATVIVGTASTLKGNLVVNGVLDLDAALTMKEGSSLDMQGIMDDAANMLKADITTVGTDLEVGGDDKPAAVAILTIHKGTKVENPDYYITGFKFTVAKTTYTDDEKEMYYQRVYLSGSITTTPTIADLTGYAGASFDILGSVFIDETFDESKTGVKATTTGTLFVEGMYSSVNDLTGLKYIGACFTTGKAETLKYFITSMDMGFAAIADANDKTVSLKTVNTYKVEFYTDVDFEDKYVVTSEGTGSIVIAEGAVFTVKSGANVDADMFAVGGIEGKLVVMKNGICVPATTLYTVTSENAAGDVTYCGFQTALDDSAEGDTITVTGAVGDVEPLKTLSIPAKRTVEIDGSIAITRALTIAEGAKFIVSGTFTMNASAVKTAKITVNGTMDVSSGTANITGYNGAGKSDDTRLQIISTGEFIYKASQKAAWEDTVMIGSEYKDGTNYVLSTVAKAIENGAKAVTINTEYTDSTPIALNGATLTVDNVKAILGTIDAKDGSVIVTGAEGKLSATINGTVGEDETASISVTGFTGQITDKAKAGKYTMDITAMSAGSLTIVSGTVAVSAAEVDFDNKNSFTVSSEATLVSEGVLSFTNAGTFNMNGALDVKNGTMDIDGAGKINLNGLVNIADGATLATNAATIAGIVNVEGTFTVAQTSTVTGIVSIDVSDGNNASMGVTQNLILGESAYKTGTGAMLLGDTIALTGYLQVYAGATVSEEIVEEMVSTAVFLNDALYMTLYEGAIATDIVNNIINEAVKIDGYDMSGMVGVNALKEWKDSDGKTLEVSGKTKIGQSDFIYFEGIAYKAKVLVSTVTGVSVFVDGVRYDSGTTINNVKVGTHTLSVTINPGYKGTTAATFAGKAVTSSFEVTSDMTGADPAAVVLSVTGDITIDPGVSPEPTPAEKEAFGITEILLVVLVILIAVMVIIVLLRMNRS